MMNYDIIRYSLVSLKVNMNRRNVYKNASENQLEYL